MHARSPPRPEPLPLRLATLLFLRKVPVAVLAQLGSPFRQAHMLRPAASLAESPALPAFYAQCAAARLTRQLGSSTRRNCCYLSRWAELLARTRWRRVAR